MIESSVVEFHQQFYINAIQKLVFHLPHVQIIVTYHWGNTWREAFKRSPAYQYVLCHQYYAEPVVDIFVHQIQS